jgi:ubiquinone/menaquinone biosynthesis C-methylase UbiE
MSTRTDWDYTALAGHYDNRADYAPAAIDRLMACMTLSPGDTVADVGAGTGKLARPLAERGLVVRAVEPNDEMRRRGIRNTEGLPVRWSEGTGEHTGLAHGSVRAVTFGSSFNVVDQGAALEESRCIVERHGWFCCLWNHRDLDDALQARIEAIIVGAIPGYRYGTRREDPTGVLADSGLFERIEPFSSSFTITMARDALVDAWRSHGTLARQADAAFEDILNAISSELRTDFVDVPYTTRGWCAQFRR